MWKRWLVCTIAVAGGCASSGEIRLNADRHLANARTLEAHGDYYGAQQEMDKAHKQYRKADARAYHEQYWY